MIEFAALPPEINSGLMYVGPGAGPMLAAAAAWDTLAAQLYSTASAYSLAISDLTSVWLGPSSNSMAAAAAPYVSWISATAGQADQAGAQAKAAVAAYEAAFAMTVPPPVIAANRALLLLLVATNFFGQNTPAIMATEAHYMAMWAQDAAAMYGYQAASQPAATFTPFASPLVNTDVGGLGSQAAAVAQAAGTSAGTGAQTVSPLVTAMSSPLSTPLTTAVAPNVLPAVTSTATTMSTATSTTSQSSWTAVASSSTALTSGTSLASGGGSATSMPTSSISSLGLANALMRTVVPTAGALGYQFQAPGMLLGNGFSAGAAAFGGPSMGSGAVTAGVGRAASVGLLSVPQNWASAAPAFSQASAALPAAGAGATPAVMPSGPGGAPGAMPVLANPAHHGIGTTAASQPKYGFRPFVTQRPVYTG